MGGRNVRPGRVRSAEGGEAGKPAEEGAHGCGSHGRVKGEGEKGEGRVEIYSRSLPIDSHVEVDVEGGEEHEAWYWHWIKRGNGKH